MNLLPAFLQSKTFQNEKGSILLYTVLLMSLLLLIGLAAGTSSELELRIAGSDRDYRQAFISAEAGIDAVLSDTSLYNSGNLDAGVPRLSMQVLNPVQEFQARVTYAGASNLPRGSGYSADSYRAHNYVLNSTGHGVSGAEVELHAKGYRVGY
ncbi:MAG: hypothetical protein C0616_08815 [Desulfuromonas sp.]|nr:MAG: hypothetical protein C0616_08815 [Desulfuromonas sp.]